jgi:hypothetical protein
MKWYNVFHMTCGCGGRPKEKIRLFAVQALDDDAALTEARARAPAGTELIIEQIV